MKGRRYAGAIGTLVLATLLAPAEAAAETESKTQAVDLGYAALQLFNASQWQPAYDRFAAAERAAHSPVFALYMARCLGKLGRLQEALVAYEKVSKEELGPSAPEAWRSAVVDAKLELEAVRTRLPRVTVQVDPPGTSVTALLLDGRPVAALPGAEALAVDPGEHELSGTDATGKKVATAFRALESQSQTVTLTFPRSQALPPPPVAKVSPSPTVETQRGRRADGFAIGLWSVGAAGLVAGTITGVLALSAASDIKENCTDGHCPAGDEARGERAESLATASTICFIAGGAAVAAGTVWFFVSPQVERSSGRVEAALLTAGGTF